MKAELEEKASAFDPLSYWSSHDLQPAVIAFKATPQTPPAPLSKPIYNMYEDYSSGRHLSETVPEFLARLPPSSSQSTDTGPWIYIANPTYRDIPTSEDLRGFKQQGAALLKEFGDAKAGIEASGTGKAKNVVGRKLTPLRKRLEDDILSLARKSGIRSGKWMLFPSANDVDRVWKLIAQDTADGELGHAAKVATDDGTGNRDSRLICVYNEDYGDKAEVKRVLQRLDDIGLVKGKGIGEQRGIYYKADAYTHLEINGGNEWGLRASLYGSKDVAREDWIEG